MTNERPVLDHIDQLESLTIEAGSIPKMPEFKGFLSPTLRDSSQVHAGMNLW